MTSMPQSELARCIQIGATAKMNSSFYLGKKVAFVYRAKRQVRGSNIRVIWGKVTRPHGMYTPCLSPGKNHDANKTRKLRSRPCPVPPQPPPSDLRRYRPRHALPLQHLNAIYVTGRNENFAQNGQARSRRLSRR